MSDELDKIRQRRLNELQQQNINQDDQLRHQQEQEAQLRAQKELLLLKILTEGAKTRLNNLRVVKPQMAEVVENQLIQLYQAGRLASVITEEQLLYMLKQLQGNKRESSIKFKRV